MVEPTHLKNLLVKLGIISQIFGVKIPKMFEPIKQGSILIQIFTQPQGLLYEQMVQTIIVSHPKVMFTTLTKGDIHQTLKQRVYIPKA